MPYFGVSELSRQLSGELPELPRPIRPRDVSDLLYQRPELAARCPLLGGRRAIPADLVPSLKRLLLERCAAKTV